MGLGHQKFQAGSPGGYLDLGVISTLTSDSYLSKMGFTRSNPEGKDTVHITNEQRNILRQEYGYLICSGRLGFFVILKS